MNKWRKWLIGEFTLRRLVRSVVEIYVCVLAWAYFFSDRIAFQPPPPTYAEDADIAYVTAPGGERIAILALANAAAPDVILYAHGNAEDIGGVRDFLEEYRAAGFEVCTFDYRGYGLSDGRPSTRNAYEDIEAVYAYLTGERRKDPRSIILHGRSVGAAAALHLANRQPVGGVIVESTFLTAFRARTQMPLAPFDKMRNDREIRRLRCPVLVIHGENDQTIKTWQGKRLYELAPEPKFAYWAANAGHDDVLVADEAEYWRQIRAFADFVHNQSGSAQAPDG